MYIEPTTQRQIVNYCVVDEFIKAESSRQAYASCVVDRLAGMGITHLFPRGTAITKSYIYQTKIKLANRSIPLELPAVFKGQPGSRYGKDMMYSEFWRTVQFHLPNQTEWSYLGLPGHQVEMVCRVVDKDKVVMCERSDEVVRWVNNVYGKFLETSPPTIYHGDIFQYMKDSKTEHSIIDLDLMVTLTRLGQVNALAHCIYDSVQDKSVINITTCIGRSCTQLQYDALMPNYLVERLKEVGFRQVQVFSGKYRDRLTPMRYQHLMLSK